MGDIWEAAKAGDVGEVERLVGQDPGLPDAGDAWDRTPLMHASIKAHLGVVRWLLDKGAAIDAMARGKVTALSLACYYGRIDVVRLLVERGADPTITSSWGSPILVITSERGHLEVLRVLLGYPSAKATINHREDHGRTALWTACYYGGGAIARALLECGADTTIANNDGTTPMAVAKQVRHDATRAEGRRECVAALEVSFLLFCPQHLLFRSAG
jgi:uncharacterized protein